MLIELITIACVGVNISILSLIFYIYFKWKNIFYNIKMNAEELIQDILQDTIKDEQQDVKREKLSAIVAGSVN